MSTNPVLPKWLTLANLLIIALNRLGMSFGTWYILSTQGRKTGKMRSTPVSVLHVNGHRYMVSGFETQWVKNARKVGGGILARGRKKEHVVLVELPVGFVGLAYSFGAEAILGAFLAGVAFRSVYKETTEIRPLLRVKLETIGFGFFVPIFFITSGIDFNLHAMFGDFSILALVPLFLAALLLVRGVPAILYQRRLDTRHTVIAGMLQATLLTFIVAATQIGVQLHLISSSISAALVASGLLSVIIYPLIALILLRSIKGEEKLNEDEPIPFIETM
ncbi:MAG TPA: cation:proton antiporter [Ktedonobacteraceae bacterium]